MRKTRLFLACCLTAASLGVAAAAPAAAQEPDCTSYPSNFINSLTPPLGSAPWVFIEDGTIVIRGDLLLGDATGLVDHYESAVATFLACLEQDVTGVVSPYVECLLEATEGLRTEGLSRYLEVDGLIVKIHYAVALEDVRLIFNCNGIVRIGD